MAKVLLVNPPRPPDGRYMEREDRCESSVPNLYPPASLAKISSILRQDGHKVFLLDLNLVGNSYNPLTSILSKNSFDYLIFRSTSETLKWDIQTADIAKSKPSDLQTVMLNWSLRPLAKKVLKSFENVGIYVTQHEYEKTIEDIVSGKPRHLVAGITYRNNDEITENPTESSPNFNFAKYPMPAWDLIPSFKHFFVQTFELSPWCPIEGTKGCGLGCLFCTLGKAIPYFRAPEKVVDEIEYLLSRGVRYVSFFDSTFNMSRSRVFEICDEILSRKLSFTWFANIRATSFSDDMAEVMYRAGCRGLSIGAESASNDILNACKKGITTDDVRETVRILKHRHIKQYLSFIVGLPKDNYETIRAIRDFILELKPNGVQVNSLVIFPSCQLNNGRDDNLDSFLLYDSPTSICELPVEEVNRLRLSIYRSVYTSPRWWLSNVSWVLRHREDLKTGLSYSIDIVKGILGFKPPHCGSFWW